MADPTRRHPLSHNAHCARSYERCRTWEHDCADERAAHEAAVADETRCDTCGAWPMADPRIALTFVQAARA